MEYGDPKEPLISIVDDDISFREALAGLLHSFGYSIATFESGPDFLVSDRRYTTACLILDIQMPRMSGLDLQAKLVEQGQATPVIFVTSRADVHTLSRAMDAGAIAVLCKPFDHGQLLTYVRMAVGG